MALTRLKNRGITDSTIANVKLVNDSVTVNGTTFDLGTSDSITAGKILQVVQAVKSGNSYTTSNTYAEAQAKNIVLTDTSNKILILCSIHLNLYGNGTTRNINGYVELRSSASDAILAHQSMVFSNESGDNTDQENRHVTFNAIHTPNSSNNTYYVVYKTENGRTGYLNGSTMTLIELAT